MKPDQAERAFDAFVRADGQRLRRVMSSQYGVDIGCESTDSALAWAWEHWDRLHEMSNPSRHVNSIGDGFSLVVGQCDIANALGVTVAQHAELKPSAA